MKRFLEKTVCFLLIFTLVLFGVNYAYVCFDQSDYYNTDKFKDVPEQLTICNLGSSHGVYSLNYDVLENESCFNFALVGQTISYDEKILNQYADRISEGTVVLIPVSYFSLYWQNEELSDSFEDKNARYYTFLDAENIKAYKIENDIQINYLPIIHAQSNLIRVIANNGQNTNLSYWKSTITEPEITEKAQASASHHLNDYMYKENGEYVLNTDELNALGNIVDRVKALGGIPVLLVTPFYHAYTDEIDRLEPDFRTMFTQVLTEFSLEKEIGFYDFSEDPEYTDNPKYFIDGDHLNYDGAAHFTETLYRTVIKGLR